MVDWMIIMGSVGKIFSVIGWKIGWVIGFVYFIFVMYLFYYLVVCGILFVL